MRADWLVTLARPVAGRPLAWGVALAGVFAVAIAIPVIHRLGRGSAQRSAQSAAQLPSRSPARSQMHPVPVGSLPPAIPETVAKSAQQSLPRPSVRPVEQTNARETVNARRATDVPDSESVAVDEMLAASRPAPPMPLTEQERLLLRIAHRGDPVELAMLDPMRRAARDVEEQTEFQRFFKPRTVEQTPTEQPATGQPATSQPTTEQPPTAQPAVAQPTTEKTPGDNE